MGKAKGFNEYKINGDIVEIYLYKRNGKKFITYIDTEDLERIKALGYRWNASYSPNPNSEYATATYKNKTYYLNVEILNPKHDKNIKIDHANHNTLDNRKENLRITTNSNNLKNRKGKNKNNKSGYRNVTWDKSGKKWIVQLQVNGKNTVLGRFVDVDKAGEFAEEMREKYYGDFKGEN